MRYEADVQATHATPFTLNGVWFNRLRCDNPQYASMRDVPKHESQLAKQKLMQLATSFVGRQLTLQRQNNRIVTHTAHGNLFGYVKRGQERLIDSAEKLTITHVRATKDGNINALVMPV